MNDDSEQQVRLKYVRVTNGLDVKFTDRFDGVPVRLDPGQTKNIRAEDAQHIFGHDLSDRAAMCKHLAKRQGWNTPKWLEQDKSGKTLAEQWFDKIKIELVMYKLVEVEADSSKPIPADPLPDNPRNAPRKVEMRA